MDFEKKLIEILSDESFQRWIANQASSAERGRWLAWLNSDPDHPRLYEHAIDLWRSGQFKPVSSTKLERDWLKLKPRLERGTRRTAEIPSSRRQRAAAGSVARYLGYAAAAAILCFAVWKLFFSNPPQPSLPPLPEMASIQTEFGQRQRLSLPDGSSIILNANSIIHYPRNWSSDSRRIVEVSGEAYFDILTNPRAEQRQFMVRTQDGLIRVLGTRFAVYERGRGTQVAVEAGSVQVATFDTSTAGTRELASLLLIPGQISQFYRGRSDMRKQVTDLAFHTTWWQERFRMANTSVWEIVRRLEETYDVEFNIDDDSLLGRKITGTIQNQNLDTILEALAKVLQVPVRRQDRVITLGD